MAWYDGEQHDGAVTGHIARCARCADLVLKMAAVDAAVRGAPTPSPAATRPAASHLVRRAAPAVAVAAAIVTILAATVPGAGSPRSIVASALHSIEGSSAPSRAATAPAPRPVPTTAALPAAGPRNPSASPGISPAHPQPTPTVAPVLPGGALLLATVVPMAGPDSPSGAEVSRAVRAAVAQANATGGVNGRPVQLQVIPADAVASRDLSGTTAFVGGFGATLPPTIPWLLPSDPDVSGPSVVAADPTPAAAGAALGSSVAQRDPAAVVGVIRAAGDAPEGALADGLATTTHAIAVTADPESPCWDELWSLRTQRATALAVAGPAGLVARCLNAAADQGWRPRDGVLVPPSAAYAGLANFPSATGSQTMLGLPWPTSDQSGARQFRSVTGSTSYPAEVAYAAAQLAIQVARSQGTLTMAQLSDRSWSTALYQYAGSTNSGAQIVTAGAGAWHTA